MGLNDGTMGYGPTASGDGSVGTNKWSRPLCAPTRKDDSTLGGRLEKRNNKKLESTF